MTNIYTRQGEYRASLNCDLILGPRQGPVLRECGTTGSEARRNQVGIRERVKSSRTDLKIIRTVDKHKGMDQRHRIPWRPMNNAPMLDTRSSALR